MNIKFQANQKLGQILSNGTIKRYQDGTIIEYSVVQDTSSNATQIRVEYWFFPPHTPNIVKPVNNGNFRKQIDLEISEIIDLNERKKTHPEDFSSCAIS